MDKTVHRVFKVHSVPNIHGAKDKKIKVTNGNNNIDVTPSVGQYDAASSADKLKYKRTNEA